MSSKTTVKNAWSARYSRNHKIVKTSEKIASYKVRMQRQNKLLQNLDMKYAEGIQTQQWWGKILLVYVNGYHCIYIKPVHVITKNSKIWQSYCNYISYI